MQVVPSKDTETRYAQPEKEMLVIVFTLKHFNQYTFLVGKYASKTTASHWGLFY